MKLFQRVSFLLVYILAIGCIAQEEPQPILIYEFERTDCELMLYRLDNFFAEIVARPNSHGYAVIFGHVSSLRRNVEYESWIRGNVSFRSFPPDRLTVLRRLAPQPKLQFWVVPVGAKPQFEGDSWTLEVPKSTRPFLFWKTSEAGCPGNPRGEFADLLKANPTSRGNIVLRGDIVWIRKEKKELAAEFTDLSGLPLKRLRFYQIPEKKNAEFGDIELWFVP